MGVIYFMKYKLKMYISKYDDNMQTISILSSDDFLNMC